MIRPQPKPVPRAKKPRKPLRARRWGISRRKQPSQAKQAIRQTGLDPSSYPAPAFAKPISPKGTKHRRRVREWGFMHFCHHRGCELRGDAELQRLLGIRHDCEGRIEFAHLHDRRRHAPGDIGAGLDRAAHLGIDGKEGGKATWYVALDYTGQHMVRMRLANRARGSWDALTPEQRAEWDRRAEEQRLAARARRP